jgi:iron complex transport system substrate-binding protein
VRICSFLPSATEILYALGLGDQVAGVTFECDYPPEARQKPIVVDTVLAHGLTQEEIDRQVSACSASGESLYRVHSELLEELQPDLIVTQELCDVCAVSTSHLLQSVSGLSKQPRVVSLTPHTLADVWADIEAVGEATGTFTQARALVMKLRERLERVKEGRTRKAPRVACLEWLTPPYNAGHWVPEMVDLAGGVDVLGRVGIDSVRIRWEDVADAQPDMILVMPCGYDTEAAMKEFRDTELPFNWAQLPAVKAGRVFAVNATAYFSRPGPRLAEGAEILGALLSEAYDEPLPEGSWTRL